MDKVFEVSGIKYRLKHTSTGLPPDSDSKMSLNMTALFIKIEGDDNWYGCLDNNHMNVNDMIESLGSPIAYILLMGYNEIYHYLARESKSSDNKKIDSMVKDIEKLHETVRNI